MRERGSGIREQGVRQRAMGLLPVALVLIVIGAVLRVLPHAPNFAPVGAIALFGGAMLSRRLALTVPVAAMLASDLFIGFYEPAVMVSVYASFLLTVLLGRWVGRYVSPLRVVSGALAGSVLFFLITNGAVWTFGHGYPPTAIGLLQSYVNGLPFFRNTLLSDLLYSSAFFGLTAAAAIVQRRATRPTPYSLPPTPSNG